MKYKSTREGGREYSFEQAIYSGYAPDGGLFVPVALPSLTVEDHLMPWSKLTFPDLAYSVLVSSLVGSLLLWSDLAAHRTILYRIAYGNYQLCVLLALTIANVHIAQGS